MKELRTQNEIMKEWIYDKSQPLLSILCTTYNHQKYIEDAIEGFLRQETDFPFEIIIHDDASTDKTAEIIRKYEYRYPNLIKAIYQIKNRFSQGLKNGDILYPMAKGKYIALCEGDDYWTDPKKLQLQVDFLESNPEYVMTGHDAYIVDENGKILSESKLPNKHKRDYEKDDLVYSNAWILTMSLVFKNIAQEYSYERHMVKNGDTFMISILGNYGKSHYHEDIKPAAYRVHGGGIWSSLNKDLKLDESINTWFWMYKYYKRIGEIKYANVYLEKFKHSVFKKNSTKELIIEAMLRFFLIREFKLFIKKILNVKTKL